MGRIKDITGNQYKNMLVLEDVDYYFEPVEGKTPVIKFPLRYASYPEDSDEYKVYSEMKKFADELGVEIVDKTDEWVIHIYDSATTVGVIDAK